MSFTLTSGEDPQRSLALGNPPKPAQQLPEKYRPAALADVVGQGEIVFALEAFLEAPHSCAFIFSGPTGVGKTTLARILGSELGAVPYGGLEEIASGMNDEIGTFERSQGLRPQKSVSIRNQTDNCARGVYDGNVITAPNTVLSPTAWIASRVRSIG